MARARAERQSAISTAKTDGNTAARLRWAILILALAGAAVSAYLTTVHLADRPVFCGGLSSCDAVATSEYSDVGGVPVALFGLGAYAAIAALAVAAWRSAWAVWAVPAILLTAAIGTLYSAYLTWVEIAILEAVCMWCAISAVIIVVITGLATWWYLHNPAPVAETEAAPPARRSR